MSIFDSLKKLDAEVQEELSSLENEYDSNEYEIEKTATVNFGNDIKALEINALKEEPVTTVGIEVRGEPLQLLPKIQDVPQE